MRPTTKKTHRLGFSPEVKAYRASKDWDRKLLGMKDGQKLLLGEGEDREGDHIYIHAHFTAETAEYDLGGRDPDSGDWTIFASNSPRGGRTWGDKSFRYTEGRRGPVAEMAANHGRKLFGVPRRMLGSTSSPKASDRQLLIRLASSLPKGSDERKAILAGLKTAAAQARFKPKVEIKFSRITSAGEDTAALEVKGTLLVHSGYAESPVPFVINLEYAAGMGVFVITDVVKPVQYTSAFTALLNAGIQENSLMGALGDSLE